MKKKSKATIYDVAKKAGVSLTTVSRALNNSDKVKKQTRERIQKVIEELNFRPNTVARGLAAKKTTTVGIIISDISHAMNAEVLNGILYIAEMFKYTIRIYPILDEKKSVNIAERAVADQVDGIIFANEELTEKSNNKIKETIIENNIPLVFANVSPQSETVSTVHIDYIKAVYDLATFLLRSGSEKLLYVQPVKPFALNNYKKRGYLKAVENNDKKEYVVQTSEDPDVAYQHLENIIKENNPDAIITATDEEAIICLNIVKSLGKKIPEDVQLVSCQDTRLLKLARPMITAIFFPAFDVGATSMRKLTKLMDEEAETMKTELQFSIIKRGSTKF